MRVNPAAGCRGFCRALTTCTLACANDASEICGDRGRATPRGSAVWTRNKIRVIQNSLASFVSQIDVDAPELRGAAHEGTPRDSRVAHEPRDDVA